MPLPHTDPPGVDEDRVEPAPARSARVRLLAVAAVGPVVVGYAAVAAVLALVTATASGAHFSTGGVLSAAAPGWLGAYQVPVTIQGRELGALPLLPTLLVLVLIWRTVASVADRLGVAGPRAAGALVFAVGASHAAVGLAVALLCSGGPATVDPLAGFYYPALLASLAAAIGVAPRSGAVPWLSGRVDVLAVRGLRAGLLAVAALLAVGTAVLSLALLASFGTVRELFDVDGTGVGTGVFLLSLAYLPNAVVAATGFVAGPGFALGEVAVGPLDFTGGPVPALPLLGALPEQRAIWWFLLFVLPAAVGALVGWVLREADESPTARLRAVSVAAVVVAMVFAVLAGSAGGALGGGPFHPLDLRAAWLSVALAAWVAVPGSIVAWVTGPRRARYDPPPATVAEDDPEDGAEPTAAAAPEDESGAGEEDQDGGGDPGADDEPGAVDPGPGSGR